MNGKWIWITGCGEQDEYADFKTAFKCEKTEGTKVSLSCDGNFAMYVNGELAGFGQYADYPHYKIVEEIDISKFCRRGENELLIIVWYYGIASSQTYYPADAGLIFEVTSNGKTVAESGEETLCRRNPSYRSGYMKMITGQLGLSFLYDANAPTDVPFGNAVAVDKKAELYPRPIKRLELLPRTPVRIYHDAEREGHYLIDLGRETVGFVELEFISDEAQKIMLTYGEHLSPGVDEAFICSDGYSTRPFPTETELQENAVPRIIGGRDFSVEYIAANGKNLYLNPFRRLGLRWLEVFCEKDIEIEYIGIRPVVYPLERKPAKVIGTGDDHTAQKIYDTSVYTLECCMHEHYEDCPWREQALYALDSRNQMLCGYYAFGEYQYPRANLVLLAKGLRDDGFLSICAPTGFDKPIPSFSLAYPLSISEYIRHSGDRSIVEDEDTGVMKALDSIMNRYYENISKNDLVPYFPYPCWNFYEWSPGSDNGSDLGRSPDAPNPDKYELISACLYIISAERYLEITGGKGKAAIYDFERIREKIRKTFYNNENGMFKLSTDSEMYSVLGNSLAILAGVLDDKASEKALAEKLISGENLIPITLSMKPFFYDALIKVDESYSDYIIDDIYKNYSHMLENGATTFWETIVGAADFGDAGSLCHGWSAVPIYYYNKLGKIIG